MQKRLIVTIIGAVMIGIGINLFTQQWQTQISPLVFIVVGVLFLIYAGGKM